MRRVGFALAIVAFGCIVAGCPSDDSKNGDPPPPPPPPPEPILDCLDPADWDGSQFDDIPGYDSEAGVAHKLFNPTHDKLLDKLVVFLPGDNANPSRHTNIIGTAAYAGMKAIGLAYNNGGDAPGNMPELCEDFGRRDDPECAGGVRRDRIYGGSYLYDLDQATPGTMNYNTDPIDEDESVVGELYNLLGELARDRPAIDWGAYYDDSATCQQHDDDDDGVALAGCIHWDQIVLAGYSQGGGDASVLSVDHAVHGTVIISSPKDRISDGGTDLDFAPAGWIEEGATPGDVRFGLYHYNEGGAPGGDPELADALEDNWDQLAYPGTTQPDAEDIDYDVLLLTAPYQRFSTALPPGSRPDAYHGSTGVDADMSTGTVPDADNPYRYDLFGVYQYMFCAAGSM